MTTPTLADLRNYYYGGGTSAEYQFLLQAYNKGLSAIDLLQLMQSSPGPPLGTSQDAANIQAAINQLTSTGGIVALGPGNYVLGSTSITIPGDNIKVRGQGSGVTRITYSGSGPTFVNSNPSVIRRYCEISDLTIFIQGATGSRGLELENFWRGKFDNLLIDGTSTACTPVKLIGGVGQSTYYNFFTNLVAIGNTRCIDVGNSCNANVFFGGVLEGAGVAFYCQPTTGTSDTNKLDSVAINTSGATIIQLGGGAGNANDNSFTNLRVEPGTPAAITFGANALRNTYFGGSLSAQVTFNTGDVSNSICVPQSNLVSNFP